MVNSFDLRYIYSRTDRHTQGVRNANHYIGLLRDKKCCCFVKTLSEREVGGGCTQGLSQYTHQILFVIHYIMCVQGTTRIWDKHSSNQIQQD